MPNILDRTRAGRVESRMGPELRDLIESSPGLGGLSLWVRFADVDQETVAYTDGKTVCAGKQYPAYNQDDRRFIVSHELLHVALQHPSRARTLAARHPDFDHTLFNVCTDAIINATLTAGLSQQPPRGAIVLEKLLRNASLWPKDTTVSQALRTWTSESLYAAIKQNAGKTDKASADIARAARSGQSSEPFHGDLLAGDVCGETQEQRDSEAREWAYRLRQAASLSPGVLDRLVGELPPVHTPWERHLRDFLRRYAGRKRRADYSRPSRRWTALERELRIVDRVDLPFQPNVKSIGAARIAIAVDTSGSIDQELLARFTAEIAAIMRLTGCAIRLIVCDAAVHQIEDLRGLAGENRLRSFKYAGGGGTDFRPAIAAAVIYKPDAMIFLTDLAGEAGNEPRFPVLWATPVQFATTTTPYGRRIILD